jgi:hypothetical protein
MAGNYTDPPGHRIPFDIDGTIGFQITPAGVVTTVANSNLVNVNDESNTGTWTSPTGPGTWYIGFFFPELRYLDHYYFEAASTAATPAKLQWSDDTTNGLDGTWHDIVNPWILDTGSPIDGYRQEINGISVSGAKALRVQITSGGSVPLIFAAMHLYGTYETGENPDRLEIWKADGSARIAPVTLDWGNAPRGSSADVHFKIKNLSATLTANDVDVTIASATDSSPSFAGSHVFSDDGGSSFFSSLTIASISPGGFSPELIMRRVTPSNAQLSLWAARLLATPDSMT